MVKKKGKKIPLPPKKGSKCCIFFMYKFHIDVHERVQGVQCHTGLGGRRGEIMHVR